MDFPPFVMVYHKRTKSPIHAEPKHFQFIPKARLGIRHYYGYAILIPVSSEILPWLFLDDNLDSLLPYPPTFIVTIPDLEQRLAIFLKELLRPFLPRFEIEPRFHLLSPTVSFNSDKIYHIIKSGRRWLWATPSQRNGSYRPGKPLFD
jgi:hypothetical protein